MDETSYDRDTHGRGVVSWIYEYWNREPITKRGVGAGIEIGVQLEGEWFHSGSVRGEDLFEPGDIHCINPAEVYDLEVCPPTDRAVQVGFIVYPDRVTEFRSEPDEILIPAGAGSSDDRLYELCREIHATRRSGISDRELRSELFDFVTRHAETRPVDPLTRAKREIERNPQDELYVAHYAEIAGMHPATFTRNFKRRWGMTPIRYRLECRLNEAALLSWSRHDLTIEEIAERVGFNDRAFFFREFQDFHGTTPAMYGRRESVVAAKAA